MGKPSKSNEFVNRSEKVWRFEEYTFCLIKADSVYDGYLVRVFPHDDRESFWLEGPCGNFETESGAAYCILNYLDES